LATEVSVTPLTDMSQEAVPALIVAPDTAIVDGAVNVTVPVQPVPANVAVAPVVRRKPDGSVSVKAMPARKGLPKVFVSRKLRGVLAPRNMDAAPKVLVNAGCVGGVMGGPTNRHWLVTPLLAFANPLIDDWPFVNAAGLVEQSLLEAKVLVIPITAMSQLAVPVFIAPAETLMVEGTVSVTVAEQPGPLTVAVAPGAKRKPEGRVSTKAMPVWTGLPVAFVRRKVSAVLPPLGMAAKAKLFVSVDRTTEPTATVTVFVEEACVTTPICCELLAVLAMVEPGGATAAPAIDAEISINQKMACLISQMPVGLNAFCLRGR